MAQRPWKVYGYDMFDRKEYPILPQHEFDSEESALNAVVRTLEGINRDQPHEDDEDSYWQDEVILVYPNGTEEHLKAIHVASVAERASVLASKAELVRFIGEEPSTKREQFIAALEERVKVMRGELVASRALELIG